MQATPTQQIGVLDFQFGMFTKFRPDTKKWKGPGYAVPSGLWQKNLDWSYRICVEGNGKVYVLNTRDMVLYWLDVASRQWVEPRQVNTSYRAKWAAMTYSKGRLYVSGGQSLDGKVAQNIMLSVLVTGRGNSSVSVQREPDMLYVRYSHGMAGVGEKLLVCGVVRDIDRLPKSEIFDLGARTWSNLADMPVAIWDFGLITTATAVFVLGGVTRFLDSDVSPTLSDTVSVFDWQTQQWTPLPKIPMPLSNAQAAYRDGSLWVLAAVTGQKEHEYAPGSAYTERLEHVLEYDVSQQTWITHHTTPDVGTYGLSAYTFPL